MFQIIILLLWLTTAESVTEYPLAKPGCQERCGNISIPYPFGIGSNCSIADGFAITCKDSFNTPKPFIDSINLEVLQISLYESTVKVNNPVITSNCPGRANGKDVDFFSSPFWFSGTYNRFTAMGCNNLALVVRGSDIITGCMSICNTHLRPSLNETGCYGINCCQTRIPRGLAFVNASLRSIVQNNSQDGCKYAFMVDYQWLSDKDIFNVSETEYVPAVLDWDLSYINYTMCNMTGSLCGANDHCLDDFYGPECFCDKGYEGKPYLPSGCRDINECNNASLNRCGDSFDCLNTPGGYHCSCPDGYISLDYIYANGTSVIYGCMRPLLPNNGNSRTKVIIIASTFSSLGALLLLICTWWLYREVNRRKEAKLKEKFFKRNGGLLLQQQLSSDQVSRPKLIYCRSLSRNAWTAC